MHWIHDKALWGRNFGSRPAHHTEEPTRKRAIIIIIRCSRTTGFLQIIVSFSNVDNLNTIHIYSSKVFICLRQRGRTGRRRSKQGDSRRAQEQTVVPVDLNEIETWDKSWTGRELIWNTICITDRIQYNLTTRKCLEEPGCSCGYDYQLQPPVHLQEPPVPRPHHQGLVHSLCLDTQPEQTSEQECIFPSKN